MAASPTELTLRELRRQGYLAAVVEKWNPHARIRQDLFGVVDVLAVGLDATDSAPGRAPGTLAVQATSSSNCAARLAKLRSEELAPVVARLRAAGWRVEVWGWRKGAKSRRWELRRQVA